MTPKDSPRRVIIMGAAGRDFHNFNMRYRDDPSARVVAFTATQIPGIANRIYPPALAGPLYPQGIPILEEGGFEALCRRESIDEVVFAYSDLAHEEVMHLGSRALSAGCDFTFLGPTTTMIEATVPVIAVSAVRTGCGKSQTVRWLADLLRRREVKATVIRHPTPYGELSRQAMQRFAKMKDLDDAECTIEEREEYEPHIAAGTVVYAGVDYVPIVKNAAQESDVILWDGGNNDFPFIRPDLHIVLVDSLRPDQVTSHHPGETALRMADVVVLAKTDVADAEDLTRLADEVGSLIPGTPIVHAASPVTLDPPESLAGKSVLIIEDGPTITHGGMAYGAGYIAARRAGAARIIDPRPFAPPLIEKVFRAYPHIGTVLPATGYGPAQLEALAQTISACPADAVVVATPVSLDKLIAIDKPVLRARYAYAEAGTPSLARITEDFLDRLEIGTTTGKPDDAK